MFGHIINGKTTIIDPDWKLNLKIFLPSLIKKLGGDRGSLEAIVGTSGAGEGGGGVTGCLCGGG